MFNFKICGIHNNREIMVSCLWCLIETLPLPLVKIHSGSCVYFNSAGYTSYIVHQILVFNEKNYLVRSGINHVETNGYIDQFPIGNDKPLDKEYFLVLVTKFFLVSFVQT